MINLNTTQFKELSKERTVLKDAFNEHLDEAIRIPSSLMPYIFSQSFFESDVYLIFPYLFRNAFKESRGQVAKKISISGFLYFKYLLAIDQLVDNDSETKTGSDVDTSSLLRCHIYHEESLKILASLYGKNAGFWDFWDQRNNDFLKSILLDKKYDPEMSFDTYKVLSMNKCSFSKVAVDAFFCRKSDASVYEETHERLLTSIDYFSIARCIQDDIEDFNKDLKFRKNNLGHILLNQWLKDKGKVFAEQPIESLEKLFFTSETVERMLAISKEYYQKAIDEVASFRSQVHGYVLMLEQLRNNVNFFKVNIQAYRINKLIDAINAPATLRKFSIAEAIRLSEQYISNTQNSDGSWFEISNMQGLSNVWATGFISSFLPDGNCSLLKAGHFLVNNRQDLLWGYNTDWVSDYDSTTCVLLSLNRLKTDIGRETKEWIKGQRENGGFSTYGEQDESLFANLRLKKKSLKGWLVEHTCVSALAFYFLSTVPEDMSLEGEKNKIRKHLLNMRNKSGVWEPYWWTSYLYPTCFIIQALHQEYEQQDEVLETAICYILAQQNEDGSFSCEVLKSKSVFYTALVLDTLCVSDRLYTRYKENIERMKEWILSQQYSNGSFAGTDFLVMPNPHVTRWKPTTSNFIRRKTGGGNTITGEVANLFSTAVASRALRRYKEAGHAEPELSELN